MTELRSMQDRFNGTNKLSVPRKSIPLFLADMLDADARSFGTKQQAAAELRRLHEENEALRQALAQPKREWVGLTDEEVDECYYWKDRLWTTDELVRHVEAKLKEKNT